MEMTNIKERLLAAINTVTPLDGYDNEDQIFGIKANISSVDMVYILQKLASDFQFKINDGFVDALAACTFGHLENLLIQYQGKGTVFQS